MAYQHGQTIKAAPVASVEQARRRNAEARLELARLEAEHKHLAPRIETMRLQVTAERRKLTRQIRELDAARAQTERIANAATTPPSTLPEPIYGGRAGLEAATAEMEAHELKGLKLARKRAPRPISHGTRNKYLEGCRCDDCEAWNERRLQNDRERYRRRADAKAA
jgi:hypothetical protein